MALATFRTEGFDDHERVPDLLKTMKVTLVRQYEIADPICPSWIMHAFVIELNPSVNLEDVRSQMERLIDVPGSKFVDMHRCHQTLDWGEEPKDMLDSAKPGPVH